MGLVWVPGGESWMGASKVPGSRNFDVEAFDDESPVHRVRVRAFWLGQHPVTNAQYRAFVQAREHWAPDVWRREGFDGDEQPATGVDWSDARAFCTWLSQASGVRAALPTEAQWEWAARGGEARKYPWGLEDPTPERAVFGRRRLAPVGGRPAGASPCGAEDMAGNVWEWTSTAWGSSVSDPDISVSGDEIDSGKSSLSASRVVRGGSWVDRPRLLRAAFRNLRPPVFRNELLGFRVCVLCDPVR